jgi:N4-gp56 family major capsid protein
LKGTTSTTSTLLKQYWHNFFLSNLYDLLAFRDVAKIAKVPNNNGKVVWFYGLGKVHPIGASLTEGSDPTARSSRASRISATLVEYGNLITNSKMFMDTSITGTKEQIMKDLTKDAASLLDSLARDAALAGGTVCFAASKTHRSNVVSASTATIKDIRRAVRLLELSSVPKFNNSNYIGLVHPDVKFDLQSDSAWVDFVKYRDSVKWDIKNEVGELYGVRFKLAPTIPVLANSGSASTDIYRTMIIGDEFLGMSDLTNLKLVMNEPARNSELGTYNAYGYYFHTVATVLSDQKAIRLESSSTLD